MSYIWGWGGFGGNWGAGWTPWSYSSWSFDDPYPTFSSYMTFGGAAFMPVFPSLFYSPFFFPFGGIGWYANPYGSSVYRPQQAAGDPAAPSAPPQPTAWPEAGGQGADVGKTTKQIGTGAPKRKPPEKPKAAPRGGVTIER